MAINKVVYGSTVLVDLTDDTVTPSTLLEGYTAHGADGAIITGTFVPEGGSAVVVTEELDEHGGIIKHITAIDLSNDTVTAGALLNGYTAHDRQGQAIVGTLIPQGVDVSEDTVTSATLLNGYTAHDASGAQITGVYVPVDLSQDTVTSNVLLAGYTAHDSSGTLVTGTYSAPDLSQDTVTSATLLSGYTAHDSSGAAITGTFEVILEEINVTPTESAQTITPSSGYTGISEVNVGAISSTYVGSDITVDPTVVINGPNITVPTGYYSDDVSTTVTTTTVATPSISVSNSGLITATSSQNTGYVTGSTTSSTQQLTTKGTTTITPSDTSQTAVSSGVYTTGAITVSAVPTETKTAIANGDVVPTTGKYLSKVTVAVPSNINNQDTTVTPTEAEQTITADAQHSGLGTVTVEAIDSNYVGSGVARRSSTNLTVSGATVTAPAGYYSTAASKSVATTTLATPSVTIDNTTGVVTGSVTQTAGYVTAGTTSDTLSLSTQAATTITPNSTEQTAVAANKYTLGAVKVAAIQTETKTATPSETEQTISPSTGKFLSSVTVGAIDDEYVGSAIDRRNSEDLTVSGATVSVPAGYYEENASKTVATGSAGSPTATKGTVSNHSISVTPSVTNTTGYITGGTKTGTAVTVDASELVSGTYSITSSGTKDVTNYASASVPSLTLPNSTSSTSSGTSKATISRSTSNQYLNIPTGFNNTAQYYTISATPNGSVTAPSSISGTAATVSTGTNTLTLTKSVSVTPNVTTEGYISAGTAGNSSVSLTASVTTKGAATYNTSSTDQTIASGTYLTGTQTIKAVTTSGISAANIKAGVTVNVGDSNDADRIIGITGTYTSDATALAADIVEGETAYVNGQLVTGTLNVITYYTGSTAPTSSLGENGDIYLQGQVS